MDRLARVLLLLYPRSFRARFEQEWMDLVAWHRARLASEPAGGLRLALTLLRDTAVALPRAYGGLLDGMGAHLRALPLELKQAARSLARSRLFSLCAIASLAVGVGANTAIFSVVDAVLVEPLPYPESERLTIVWNEYTTAGESRFPLAGIEIAELGEEPGLFESIGGVWATSVTLGAPDGAPLQVPAALTTPDFFATLGVAPALGRDFTSERGSGEGPDGVILSHELWLGALGGSPDILEAPIEIDGRTIPVLGVLPEGFGLAFPADGSIPERIDVYLPLPWDLRTYRQGIRHLRTVARLAPGVDIAQAQATVDDVTVRLRALDPELVTPEDSYNLHPLHADSVRAARPALQALLAAVGLFLLLAAANVASLVLARASARGEEMAVRRSLGATTGQLVRLVTSESLLIGVVGSVLGVWLGAYAARLLWALRPEGIARVDLVQVDGTVLVYTIGVSVIATLVFGLAPLATLRRGDVASTLRSGGSRAVGTRSRAREWITVGEIAVGLVLLAGAALMGQTLARLARADVGFEPSGLVTFKVALSEQWFPTDGERARLAREIERRVGALAGVSAAGATSHIPFGAWPNWASPAPPEGTPENEQEVYMVDHRSVTPGYFDAIAARVEQGRVFDETDGDGSEPVIVVDRAMADRAYPGVDALGRILVAHRYFEGEFVATPARIVGIVASARDVAPSRPSRGQVFWAFEQSARWELTWAVRSDAEREGLLADVRTQVHAVSPDLAVSSVIEMEDLVRSASAGARFVALLGSVFALLALCLAAFGLYGVVTYASVQRAREFGLRRIVGARHGDILREVLSDGLRLGTRGVVLGLAGAFVLTRFLGALLYDISPTDPATLAGVAVVVFVVQLSASLAPAVQAMRADPLSAMRD